MPKSKTRAKVRAQKRDAARRDQRDQHAAFHYVASIYADLYLAQQLTARGWHYEGPNPRTGAESWHEPGECRSPGLMRVQHALLPDGYADDSTPLYLIHYGDGEVEGCADANDVLDAVDTAAGAPCSCADCAGGRADAERSGE